MLFRIAEKIFLRYNRKRFAAVSIIAQRRAERKISFPAADCYLSGTAFVIYSEGEIQRREDAS